MMKSLKTAQNQTLAFDFVMEKHGWAKLVFMLDDKEFLIYLSDVLDPFQQFIYWIDDVAKNKLPAQINIDEEGIVTSLIAEPYLENEIKIMVKRFAYDEVQFETIVSRPKFIKKFRLEFLRFFKQDFDVEHWGNRNFDPKTDVSYDLKNIVLSHHWYIDKHY